MGKIDRFLKKGMSKKLFALLLCVVLMWFDKLSEFNFMIIMSVYLGVQGIQDVAKARFSTVDPDRPETPSTKE